MAFRLRTLGTVSLTHDGIPLRGRATQRRRLALLALLAAARERGMTRDKVVAYLWPERDTEGARHTLSQTLYSIRQDMGDDIVLSGVDELRLNSVSASSDLAEFEDALSAGRTEDAIALYGGPFLDGFFLGEAPEFERWADEERRRLASVFGNSLESLAATLAARGDTRRAVECWRRRAALDPLNGRVAVSLMRALADAGDRAGAIQHARVHTVLMRSELDVPADDAVSAFADRIRIEQAMPAARASAGRDSAGIAVFPQSIQAMTAGAHASTQYAPTSDRSTAPASLPDEAPLNGRFAVAESATSPAPIAPAADPVQPSTRWQRPLLAAAAGMLLVVASVGALVISPGATAPEPPRTIVLGAITGPDSVLALAVREALLGGLASSPSIQVVSDARVAETLRLMRLAPDASLTPSVATDVAQRRGAALAIVGGVVPLGAGAQLTVRLLDTRTGVAVVTLGATPATEDEIVPAVTGLIAALRLRVLGARVGRAEDSLPAVSTASIDALRSYALARRALARQDRAEAIAELEAALVHDSTFALAHYLAGDLLWFTDQQRHSEAHLASAYQLSSRLPLRERLIVGARYEQLVRDRPDSALASWKALATAYPDETLAFEGMGWAYRALGMHRDAADAAARALELDPGALAPNVNNRLFSLLALGDTAAAFDFARDIPRDVSSAMVFARYSAAMMRGDFAGAIAIATDDAERGDSTSMVNAAGWQHPALLALGRVEEARHMLARIVAADGAQYAPRALLLQGRIELALGVRPERARALARQTLEWIEGADLSPPAYARLAERTADLAARVGDRSTIAALRRLLERQDAGRGLPSYRLALATIEASDAFARGDWRNAAQLAERAQGGIYFGRSMSTIALLEADARAAAGEVDRARVIRQELLARSRPDNDGETVTILAALGRLAGEDAARAGLTPLRLP